MNINVLQKSRGMHLDDSITSIHIKLKDYADAPKVIAALERSFPPGRSLSKHGKRNRAAVVSCRSRNSDPERVIVPDYHRRGSHPRDLLHDRG